MSQASPFLPARLPTWGDDANGHEQDVFLLVQVQLLQPHLELYEGLNQLQGVPSCVCVRERAVSMRAEASTLPESTPGHPPCPSLPVVARSSSRCLVTTPRVQRL